MENTTANAVYVVAGYKSWNKEVYEDTIARYPGRWHFIGEREALTPEALRALKPKYVFFLHWSWKVPDAIVNEFACVNFHMTDLPFGRGGSPLQNLIVRGYEKTKISALRMTPELDAGPVYCKEDLTLEGTAQEIFERASRVCARMIKRIIEEEPAPREQTGDVVVFRRRTPEESEIPEDLSLKELYDFIRMLDGEGYPPAFRKYGGFRYEYTDAKLYDDHVNATVQITPERT